MAWEKTAAALGKIALPAEFIAPGGIAGRILDFPRTGDRH
jgi:hypothetical protein